MFRHVFPTEEGRGSHKRGPRAVPRATGLPGLRGPARGAPRQSSQSGPLAGTGKPAPQGNLGIKEEGAQASSLHPFSWNISMRLELLTELYALLRDC